MQKSKYIWSYRAALYCIEEIVSNFFNKWILPEKDKHL